MKEKKMNELEMIFFDELNISEEEYKEYEEVKSMSYRKNSDIDVLKGWSN